MIIRALLAGNFNLRQVHGKRIAACAMPSGAGATRLPVIRIR